MDLVIGLLVWGALALLAFRVAVRWFGGGTPPDARRAGDAAQPARPAVSGPATPAPAPTRRWTGGVLADETLREEEAFVDGAVIGYHLARHHHQRELDELEQELREEARTTSDVADGDDDPWAWATGGWASGAPDDADVGDADVDDDWGFDDGDEDDDDW
jgi:hypothetical protein